MLSDSEIEVCFFFFLYLFLSLLCLRNSFSFSTVRCFLEIYFTCVRLFILKLPIKILSTKNTCLLEQVACSSKEKQIATGQTGII